MATSKQRATAKKNLRKARAARENKQSNSESNTRSNPDQQGQS